MNNKIKTPEDVKNTSADALIPMVEWNDENAPICHFCGQRVTRYSASVGSKRFYLAKKCDCATARAAHEHNKAIDPFYEDRHEL